VNADRNWDKRQTIGVTLLTATHRWAVRFGYILIAGLVACSSTEPVDAGETVQPQLLSDVDLTRSMFACVSAAGIDGVLDIDSASGPSTSYFVGTPSEEGLLQEAQTRCYQSLVRVGLARGETVLATDEELRTRLVFLKEAALCLQGQGIEVGTAPSVAEYVESAGTAWIPHANVLLSDLPTERIEQIFVRCPQF